MGHGTSSGRSGGMNDAIRKRADYVGDDEVVRQINDQLRHGLGTNGEYASVDPDSIRITSDARRNNQGFGTVSADYEVNLRIPVGVDPETGRIEVEYDTEYRSREFNVRLLRR